MIDPSARSGYLRAALAGFGVFGAFVIVADARSGWLMAARLVMAVGFLVFAATQLWRNPGAFRAAPVTWSVVGAIVLVAGLALVVGSLS